MTTYDIKNYLQQFHTSLDKNVLSALQENKAVAVAAQNESLANELWRLEEIFRIQQDYLLMFNRLKNREYLDAWRVLSSIDVSLGNLKFNADFESQYYHIPFISSILRNYEMIYPDFIFTSREMLVEKESCSICGRLVSLRNGCPHTPGKIYMGELCTRRIAKAKFLAFAIVKNPLDKYAVLEIENHPYDYSILDDVVPKLNSPYTHWSVSKSEIKKPIFNNVPRNSKCPCGSGKKYKKCCLNTPNELETHYKITISD